jgi:hypothetical protein
MNQKNVETGCLHVEISPPGGALNSAGSGEKNWKFTFRRTKSEIYA